MAKGLEVVVFGLVDQNITVGQKENAFLLPGLPQAPDDLEGGVGFAGAGCHNQQDAILPAGDGLNGAVNGVHLIIAWAATGAVIVIGGFHALLRFALQPFPLAVAPPEFAGAGELLHAQSGFNLATSAAAVMEQKAAAVAGEYEGYVQRFCVAERLLHAGAN